MWVWQNGRKRWTGSAYCFPDPPGGYQSWEEFYTSARQLKGFELPSFKLHERADNRYEKVIHFDEKTLNYYAQSALSLKELNQMLGMDIIRCRPMWSTRKIRRMIKIVVRDVLERRKKNEYM